jgi:hypothetical protein
VDRRKAVYPIDVSGRPETDPINTVANGVPERDEIVGIAVKMLPGKHFGVDCEW